VAIKVLNPPNRKHAADKRFRNEMIFREKATHENIVAVLDRGVMGSRSFYVMRLYPQTLLKLMAAARPDPKTVLSRLTVRSGVVSGSLGAAQIKPVVTSNVYSEIA
jgi:hypothetical protein